MDALAATLSRPLLSPWGLLLSCALVLHDLTLVRLKRLCIVLLLAEASHRAFTFPLALTRDGRVRSLSPSPSPPPPSSGAAEDDDDDDGEFVPPPPSYAALLTDNALRSVWLTLIMVFLERDWVHVRFLLALAAFAVSLYYHVDAFLDGAVRQRQQPAYWRDDDDARFDASVVRTRVGTAIHLSLLRRACGVMRYDPAVQAARRQFLVDKDADRLTLALMQAAPLSTASNSPSLPNMARRFAAPPQRMLSAVERRISRAGGWATAELVFRALPWGLDPGPDPLWFLSVLALGLAIHRAAFEAALGEASSAKPIATLTRYFLALYLSARFVICSLRPSSPSASPSLPLPPPPPPSSSVPTSPLPPPTRTPSSSALSNRT